MYGATTCNRERLSATDGRFLVLDILNEKDIRTAHFAGDLADPLHVVMELDVFVEWIWPYEYLWGIAGQKRRLVLNVKHFARHDGRVVRTFLFRDSEVVAVAFHGGHRYICMSSSELHTLYRAFTDAGGHWSTFVIWAKHHFTLGRSDYQRQYEPILYGWAQGAAHFWCGARDQGDGWPIARPMANREHPTAKPVELVERALNNSSRHGDTVLDPFAGSGTTLIACQRRKRRVRLVELDPRYADVICQRWQRFSGHPAVLQGDGRGFDRIAREGRPAAA
jgi:hypothetical protein